MRKIFIILAAVVLSGTTVSAQSLKEILKSTAGTVLNTVAGAVTPLDLTSGTLTYKSAAVELVSDSNALSNVAGKAAEGTIEAKVNNELEKVGIKEGFITFDFASDSTFQMHFKNRTVSGTYTVADNAITLVFGKVLKSVTMTGTVTSTTNGCKMVFPSQKFLNFIKVVLKLAGNKSNTASTISNLLKNYDNLKLGFYLTK